MGKIVIRFHETVHPEHRIRILLWRIQDSSRFSNMELKKKFKDTWGTDTEPY